MTGYINHIINTQVFSASYSDFEYHNIYNVFD
jgi:hypothetical protein